MKYALMNLEKVKKSVNRATWFMLCFSFSIFISCKSTNSSGPASRTKSDIVNSQIHNPNGDFIGCRPSMGECELSCPQRNGRGIANAPECRDDPAGFPIACYCPGQSGIPPVDMSKFDFMGCYYSAGECSSICAGREVAYRPDDERCALELPANIGCYCSKVSGL